MKLENVRRTALPGLTQYEAIYVANSRRTYTIHFTYPDTYRDPIGEEAFFIVGALLAFVRRENYAQTQIVSPELKQGFEKAARIWCDWYPFLKQIEIDVPTGDIASQIPEGPERVSASFFSGGVDSLFTSTKLGKAMTGFVSIAHTSNDADEIKAAFEHFNDLRGYSDATNRKHLLIATNMMIHAPELLDTWAWLSHGAALGAVGHILSGELAEAVISSSDAWHQLGPWGSHPEVDILFSSDGMKVSHFGNDYDRVEKTLAIAGDDEAMRILSVCEHGRAKEGPLNCSVCQKCTRTMITLDLAGVDKSVATSFDWDKYDPARLKDYSLRHEHEIVFLEEIIEKCREVGRTDLIPHVQAMIDNSKWVIYFANIEKALRQRFISLSRVRPFLLNMRRTFYKVFGLKVRT